MTLSQIIQRGKQTLEASTASFGDATDHMTQIAELALGLKRDQIYLHWEEPLSENDSQKISNLLQKRLSGHPLQYLAGVSGFWRSSFFVGPGVLIPRPETELLIETVLRDSGNVRQKIAELGAGSGNIGISVLIERPDWEWWAFEKNPESFPYAKKNREALLPSSAAYYLELGDFFEKAPKYGPFDWIVTNPPYVPSHSILELSAEVRHEPRFALDGGTDGFSVIQMLAKSAPLLAKTGTILMEIAEDQGNRAAKLLTDEGFEAVQVLKDRAGLDRVVLAKKG